jgi:hypothetical protein
MFYCTLYQETSGTARVRLILAFTEERDAYNAETEVVKAAKSLGARTEERKVRKWYGFNQTLMAGHIHCPGPAGNEIFVVDNNKGEKVYYTVIETEENLGTYKRLYHPIKALIVDGKEFLQRCREANTENSPIDWYDELSDLNG